MSWSSPRQRPSQSYTAASDTDDVDNALLDKAIDARLKHQHEEDTRYFEGDETPPPPPNVKCERKSNVVNCTNSTDPYCQDKG